VSEASLSERCQSLLLFTTSCLSNRVWRRTGCTC